MIHVKMNFKAAVTNRFFIKKIERFIFFGLLIALPFAPKAQVVADPNTTIVNFDDKWDAVSDWFQVDRDNTGANCGILFGDRNGRGTNIKSRCLGFINTPAYNYDGGKNASMMSLGFMQWSSSDDNTRTMNNVLNLLPSGYVGIGARDPGSKLEVRNGVISSVSGGTTNPNGVISYLQQQPGFVASLRTSNADNTSSSYTGRFLITTGPSANVPFLSIETVEPNIPICMRPGGSSVMQLYQNQVLIGANLPTPSVTGITPITKTNYMLGVRGRIAAEGLTCMALSRWADFVFDDDYRLKPLGEIATFIQKNKHLPGIPSTSEVKENGIDVTEMMKLQMQKIEELTLHIIKQQKEIDTLKKRLKK